MAMNNRLLRPLATPGLLDLVPGAAAAYSLRSLSRSYAGPVVTVRRSSDDAEDSFTAAEVSDGTLAAFCGAGDGFVKTWFDQSGSNDASQTTAGYQPKIVSSGVVILEEGKPAIQFDGTDNRMTASQSHSQPATFISVATLTGSGSHLLYDGTTSSARNTFDASGIAYAGLFGLDGTGFVSNKQALHVVFYSGANSTIHKNGALDATGNPGTQGIVGLTIGSAWNSAAFWQGTLQELLIYESDLSSQRELIEGNIAWSYSQ